MFTLSSYHLLSLVLAAVFSASIITAFLGFARNQLQFFLYLAIYPFLLCLISLIIPQSATQLLVYSLYICGLVLGIYKLLLKFNWRIHYHKYSAVFFKLSNEQKFLVIFTAAHVLSTFIGSTIFRGEGDIVDAMTYHLGSPKEWALYLGGAKLNVNNPETLTAGYFEYIQYSIFLIVKPLYIYLKPLQSSHHEFLSYTLLVNAQLLTAFISVVLIPLIILKLFRERWVLACLTILLIYGMKDLTWTWHTAKNDAYPLYCALLSFLYLLEHQDSPRKILPVFITFMILGIAIGTKITNIYPIFPLLVFLLVLNLPKIKSGTRDYKDLPTLIIAAAVGGFVGLMPFLTRNLIETGNPFYPTDSALFPNQYLSDTVAIMHKRYSFPTTWPVAFLKIKTLFWNNPSILLILITSIVLKQWNYPLFFLVLIVVISKITGELFSWRQISTLIFLFIIWIAHLFDTIIHLKLRYKKQLSYTLVILILILSQFKPERFFKYPLRHYLVTCEESISRKYYAWDRQFKENLQYRETDGHVSVSEYGSYFSRFPFVSTAESRPELRTYYK